jgi:hypothetical protein
MPDENDFEKRANFERAASVELSYFEPNARKAQAAVFDTQYVYEHSLVLIGV